MDELQKLLAKWAVKCEAELLEKKKTAEQAKDYSVAPRVQQVSATEAENLCKINKVEYKPGYEGRILEFTISTEATDDGGDIMRMDGADLSRFKANPVIHYNHKTMETPVAHCLKIWTTPDKEMKAWALFPDSTVDTSGKSELVFNMAKAGFIRGASIGFIPVKTSRPETEAERVEMGLGQWGLCYEKWKMTEWSVCNVPMNQEALSACMKAMAQLDGAFNQAAPQAKAETITAPAGIHVTVNLDMTEIKNLYDKMEAVFVQLKTLNASPREGGEREPENKRIYDGDLKQLFNLNLK